MKYQSTKIIELGSCAFRQWKAHHSHCKFIHGYQLKAKFWFECRELDDKNWCVDFGGLKDLKKILQNQFDHTLCIAQDDPLLPLFKTLHEQGGCDLRVMDGVGIEKTAQWCYYAAEAFLSKAFGDRVWVSKVEVWEHAENSATFVDGKYFRDPNNL
jgi:6-pyruvoyltetrahydropterin/6-carboxytetrahydropterin synthase